MKVKNTDDLSDAIWDQQLLEDRLQAVALVNKVACTLALHKDGGLGHDVKRAENMLGELDTVEALWDKYVKFTDVDDNSSYKVRTKAFLDIVDWPEHLDYNRIRRQEDLERFESNIPYMLTYMAWRMASGNMDRRIPWMFRKARLFIRNTIKD